MLLAASVAGALIGLPWTGRARGWRVRAAFVLVPPAAVLALQWLFNQRFDFHNDIMTGGEDTRGLLAVLGANLPVKAGAIFVFFRDMALDFGRSRHLFVLYLAALVLGGRYVWRPPARFAAVAIGLGWIGYFLAYVVSYHDLTWHLGTSAGRVTSHLMGAIVVLLATVVRDVSVPSGDA